MFCVTTLTKKIFINFYRIPITFFWDTDDSRLLACEVRSIQKSIKSPSHSISTTTNSSNLCESLIKIMFIKESDINELETINLNSGQQLINLCAPHAVSNFYFYFILNNKKKHFHRLH